MLRFICQQYNYKTNISLITSQVYATLQSSIEPLSDPLAKVIDITIESCSHGFLLGKDTCVCRPELNLSSITCDINTQNCPFDYCNDGNIQFKVTFSKFPLSLKLYHILTIV